VGVDIHEKRAQNDVMDHNPACGHLSRSAPPTWVVRKIEAAMKRRKDTKRMYYYDYKSKTH